MSYHRDQLQYIRLPNSRAGKGGEVKLNSYQVATVQPTGAR